MEEKRATFGLGATETHTVIDFSSSLQLRLTKLPVWMPKKENTKAGALLQPRKDFSCWAWARCWLWMVGNEKTTQRRPWWAIWCWIMNLYGFFRRPFSSSEKRRKVAIKWTLVSSSPIIKNQKHLETRVRLITFDFLLSSSFRALFPFLRGTFGCCVGGIVEFCQIQPVKTFQDSPTRSQQSSRVVKSTESCWMRPLSRSCVSPKMLSNEDIRGSQNPVQVTNLKPKQPEMITKHDKVVCTTRFHFLEAEFMGWNDVVACYASKRGICITTLNLFSLRW